MGYRKLNAMSVFGTLLIAGTVAACARYQEPSFGNYEVVRHVFTHPISGNHTQWLQLRAEIDPGTTTIGQVRVYYNLHPTRDPATFPSRVARSSSSCSANLAARLRSPRTPMRPSW